MTKDYTRMVITSPKITRKEAERREARNIGSYIKATGRRPKYNKTNSGKFERRY